MKGKNFCSSHREYNQTIIELWEEWLPDRILQSTVLAVPFHMKQDFPGTYNSFCTQNPVSLLMRIFWEQPCHCFQERSPLSVHYIHPQFPLFGVGWVSGALLYLSGGSVQFPTGMLESRASLLMLCQCCKPRLPSASLGSAAQNCCSPHLCHCWEWGLVHKEMERNGGGFPRPTTGHWLCPPGNLLSGDQLVLLCLSLELCLWLHLLHGRPLPFAGTSQVWSTQAKPLGSGWRWGGLNGNGPWASHLLHIHPYISITINKPLQKEEENWPFNKSPLFTQSC